MKKLWSGLIAVALLTSCVKKADHETRENVAVRPILFGDIRPEGWIKEQMLFDVREGFVGHLDQLVPELILQDDIYGEDRLTKLVKSKDVGAITGDNGEWQVQFLWWNSETQSNWWDGFIRHAILTQDKTAISRVNYYVKEKLATQDADGYIGIYGPDLRYDHQTENGELWAQSSLFRGLLAWYEYTRDVRVLEAIEKAISLTMKKYPIHSSEPFNVQKPYAGVGHGLTLVDVLNRLYELTGKVRYLDYALFLFEDYNRYDLSEVDIRVENLLDTAYRFQGHGVHTYEHLRALVIAATHDPDPVYDTALAAYLDRLVRVTTPSGAPIGDEWISGRTAHPDETGYEYCSLQELLDSYGLLLAKTGEAQWADKMEWLLFNAAQGSRHPDGKSIAYCKTDNSYFMEGALERENIGKDNHNRFKYSPVHQEVAVCCVPNAGRIYPYYVRSMWSTTSAGLRLNLFGPSVLDTQVNGSEVRIEQRSEYPFDLSVHLKLTLTEKQAFQIAIRKPGWASDYQVSSGSKVSEASGYIVLEKEWQDGDEVKIAFDATPRLQTDFAGESFISHGPLVYGLAIEGEKNVKKTYRFGGFEDLNYSSEFSESDQWMLRDPGQLLTVSQNPSAKPWSGKELSVNLVNATGQTKNAALLPMGGLVLRQVTFPVQSRK